MSDDFGWRVKRYVFEEMSDDGLMASIKEAKEDVGDVTLDFTSMDWDKLQIERRDVRGELTGQTSEFPLLPDALDVLETSEGAADGAKNALEAAKPIVEAKEDSALAKSFAKLQKYSEDAKGDEKRIVDYFAPLLLPSAVELKNDAASVLQLLMDKILGFLKQIVGYIKSSGEKLWALIANIDDYYLRLRGELEEARETFKGTPLAFVLEAPAILKLQARLLLDERVPKKAKRAFGASLLYFVSPIDFLPEATMGAPGYVDDVVIAASCIAELTSTKYISRELIEEHWSGNTETLDLVLACSNEMVKRVAFFHRIVKWFMTQVGMGGPAAKATS